MIGLVSVVGGLLVNVGDVIGSSLMRVVSMIVSVCVDCTAWF